MGKAVERYLAALIAFGFVAMLSTAGVLAALLSLAAAAVAAVVCSLVQGGRDDARRRERPKPAPLRSASRRAVEPAIYDGADGWERPAAAESW